jgi:uncharacterized protein YndB with AHSA1/START domain
MGPITAKVEIDLPREQIFETIADLSLRPGFTGDYQRDFRLERIDSRGVGAGARFRARPGGAWSNTEIVRIEAPYRLVEEGRTGRLNRVETKTVWELVELPSGVTQVSVTYFTRPSNLFDHLTEIRQRANGRHRRGWEGALRKLREQLETGIGTGIEPVRVAGKDRLPLAPSGTLASI